jgi:O-antigen ligase
MPLDWIVEQLTMFGVALAVFGIVQRVVGGPGAALVYGFWQPQSPSTPFGPFINRNHFAGWMVLVLPMAVACAGASVHAADHPSGRDWRHWFRWLITPDANRFVFLGTATLIMATSLVMTGSRSGLASLVVALAVLAWFAAKPGAHVARRLLPSLYLVVLVVAAVGWVGVSRTAARFDRAGEELAERVSVWRDAVSIIRDFPITGVGAGAFGEAMLVYQTSDRRSIYEQAHNEYLQILAEGGALVAGPVLILGVLIVRSIRHRLQGNDDGRTYWVRVGAVAGLVGIAAQSLVEFSLQMPGNALMCVFLLAVALHRPSTHHPHANRV